MKFNILPLSQRDGDVELLAEKFVNEAVLFFSGNRELEFDFEPDLSQNAISLRQQL